MEALLEKEEFENEQIKQHHQRLIEENSRKLLHSNYMNEHTQLSF